MHALGSDAERARVWVKGGDAFFFLSFILVCSEFCGDAPPPSGSLCRATVACGMQGLEEVHEQDFSDAINKC